MTRWYNETQFPSSASFTAATDVSFLPSARAVTAAPGFGLSPSTIHERSLA